MHRHRLVLSGVLCAIVLAAVPASAQECADRFWAPRSLMTYDDPRDAVIGDFDGDGRADLAVTVYTGAGGLRVFLQRADGTHAESVYDDTHGVGPRTSALATADLDGDGDLDLVVVNDNHTFSVFANDGAGAFTHRQTLAGWGDLALGDLDGDGDPEVVLAGGTTHDVSVYTNTRGTFAFAAGYAVAGTPGWVVLADLDSDARLDVAVAANADASVSVLWNAGTGALLPAVRLQGHLSTWNLVAGDVNGDGRADLLTGQFQGTQVGVLANLGGRTFAPLVGFATATRTTVLALGDTDGDGDLDLAVTGGVSVAPPAETVSLWRNAGDGTFALADRVSGGDEPGSAAFGDLDGDGDQDLVVVASASNSVRLYANAGGHLAASPDAALGGNSIGDASGATAITHADLDGDGRDDLIVTQRTQLRVFTRAGAPPAVYATSTFSSDVAAGDMDGDGDRDVVLVDQTNDQISTRRNDGTGRLTLPIVRSTCDQPRAVSLADMDGDGDLDAVVACASDSSVVVMTNDGTGVLALGGGGHVFAGAGGGPWDVAIADLDGDGDRDLAVVRAHGLKILTKQASQFVQSWSSGADCLGAESMAAGDVNGDGRIDVALACPATSRVKTYLNAGGGAFTAGVSLEVIQPRTVALADVDGDGDRDLLAVRGKDHSVVVFDNGGTGGFAFSGAWGAGPDSWPLAAGDLDGDGDVDLAVGGRIHPFVTTLLNPRVGCPGNAALSVAGGQVAEGDAGTRTLPFTVRLSTALSWAVTVDYATSDGTAGAADYAPASGTLTFAMGETQKTVAVTVYGDEADEPDETVFLDLSNASGAPVGTAQASGTIANDDAPEVTLTIDLVSFEAGHGSVHVTPPSLDGSQSCDDPSQGPGPFTCTFRYPPGTQVTVQAGAYEGSAFQQFDDACTGTGPCAVTLDGPGPARVAAVFLGPRTLTVDLVSFEGGHGLVYVTPASLDGSQYCDDPSQGPGPFTCTFRYAPGTQVSLHPGAYEGSVFQQFDGACTGTGPCWMTLSGPGSGPRVAAVFLGPRTLTVDLVSFEGGHGLVYVTPASLDGSQYCDDPSQGPGPFTCTFRYTPGTQVSVHTGAYEGSVFQQFDGACTGTGPCWMTLSGPGSGPRVAAVFLGPRTLTVDLVSFEGGHGLVHVTPASLDGSQYCDDPSQGPGPFTCTFRYTPGTQVSVHTGAYEGSVFQQFDGACTGTGPCWMTLSGPGPGPRVAASFLGPRTLTVDIVSVEDGNGLVLVLPSSLDGSSYCYDPRMTPGPYTCTFRYAPGTQVIVHASPHDGSAFQQFDGTCSGTGPCVVTLAGPGSPWRVAASFLGPRTLTASLSSVNGGHGILTVSPLAVSGADSCVLPSGQPSATCTFAYAPDTAVTVTAAPAPGSVLAAMGGACPASGPCVVTMSAAATVTASFALANQPPTAQAGGPYAGLRGQAIGFDGSGSSDPDGQPLTFLWTFSDGGTAAGVSPTHAFATLGTHTATLVVSDGTAVSGPSTASVTIANALPTVVLTAPAGGSTHPASGPIELAADALDADGAIVRVAFYAGAALVGEAFAPPFTAAWPGGAPGTYVVTAQATDSDGATTTSAPRTVHLNPGPTVALTSPANGTVFVAGATVPLTATASDDLGVARVEFYAGASLVGTDTSSPYAFAWPNVPAGRYVLTARAVDSTGGTAVSSPVTIDVARALPAVADSYVRDNSGGNDNYGRSPALETRTGSSGSNRWTYLRFDISRVSTVQAARLRLFGNLATTTSVAVQARAFSSADVSWAENAIVWNNKPAPGPTVLASVPLVGNSTTARWYEWDLTAFVQAEKAAGRTAITIVLVNDVPTSPHATFRSRQAPSDTPELRVTP